MKTLKSVNSISKSDEILASLEINGHQLASIKRYDFMSLDEVIRSIVGLAGSFVGLAKLNVRNKTQGWKMVMGIASRPVMAQCPQTLPTSTSSSGRQLSIAWN